METIREVEHIKLMYDECGGLYQLTDGERKSKKFGGYGGGYFLQISDEVFVKEAEEDFLNK